MSTVEPFADLDVSEIAAWLEAIPVEHWPGMADLDWHGARARLNPLRDAVIGHFDGCAVMGYGLFLLAAGQGHPTHTDVQPPEWVTRVHVPIVTNPQAIVITDEGTVHMEAGRAYRFDTRRNHAVANGGTTPRVHFILDVREVT